MGSPHHRRFGDGTAVAATAVLATLAAAVLVLLSGAAWAQAGTASQGGGIQFNGRPLDAQGQRVLRQLEARTGPVPPGRYWYDPMTGAAGVWGGPVAVVLAPGLPLGGPLPATASGGGQGRLTGVFVNGRELHPFDVQRLQTVGPVVPGRYRWDAAGNVATEAGVPLFNFNAAVARRGGNNPYYRSDVSRGESVFVGKGCTAVSGRTSPGDSSSSYSYYVGC
ncbi:hypothetical protein [Ideonella sp. A 288]|uniref:hypothetical protein n=1 Tax=Ideonella sp. A 288 TaxID=1962181 RepID=UPI000B4A5C1B|nr:hypothetical protein [Ideonella sp. A 288]